MSTDFTLQFPLPLNSVAAGFPSPADDFIDKQLSLNELLIVHPAATYFLRVQGRSMEGAGIQDGDMLIVDRALEAQNQDVVIATVDGEFTIKYFQKENNKILLVPANPNFPRLEISEENNLQIWGVVTYVISKLRA